MEIIKYECPSCGNILIENNKNTFLINDLIIKSKLVFLNEDGKVLCKCSQCKKIISLPLDFYKSEKVIKQSTTIDL